MIRPTELRIGGSVFGALVLLIALGPCSTSASTTKGQNAIYNSSGTAASPAFIDAYVFGGTGTNICGVLNTILNPANGFLPSSGAIIDARGLPAANTSMNCSISPWQNFNTPPASTILLPAATISIPGTWTVPSGTRLIGQGYGTTGGTVVQANPSFPTVNPMKVIRLGGSSLGQSCASGISD